MTLSVSFVLLYVLASALLLGPALYAGLVRRDEGAAVLLMVAWLVLTCVLTVILFQVPTAQIQAGAGYVLLV